MKKKPIQRALIVGATSGIGKETALQLLQKGWILGLAGRREEKLKELQQLAPDRIHIRAIDICQAEAPDRLQELIDEMGGMDLYLHCSGVGHQNYALAPDIELQTLETNGTGFVRMVTAAFRYFARQQGGHLAVISSIAGTKGLGAAPAYSATKRFQNIYIDSLEQLAYMQHLPILALPYHGSPLAPDTAYRLETIAHQELTSTRLSFTTISFRRRYT